VFAGKIVRRRPECAAKFVEKLPSVAHVVDAVDRVTKANRQDAAVSHTPLLDQPASAEFVFENVKPPPLDRVWRKSKGRHRPALPPLVDDRHLERPISV
jgi:hypothetical protein